MYVSWKTIRGKLIVGLIVLLLDFSGWWFVANFYGFDVLPQWSRIVAMVQEFRPTLDNLYDGIRTSVELVREGLEKVEHLLRKGPV
jgi:hypothetical protein